MQVFLKKHGPETACHRVKASWSHTSSGLGQQVIIEFAVHKRTNSPWLSDPLFTQEWSKNWGLWNKDVVEAFIQLRSHPEDLKAPYLELQVSPLNRPFALIITEPRKTYFVPHHLEFVSTVSVSEREWKTRIEVHLPSDLKGELLYGGLFACLSQGPREFYAIEPNLEETPDFHRPDLFVAWAE